MTMTNTAASYGAGASSPSSLAAKPSTAQDLANAAGSSSGPSHGSTTSAASEPATNGTPKPTKPSSTSPAPSSANATYAHCETASKRARRFLRHGRDHENL